MVVVYFFFYRARRAAKEAKEAPAQPAPAKVKVEVKKFVKIGRPGYKGKLVMYQCSHYTDMLQLYYNLMHFPCLSLSLLVSDQTERPWDGTAVFTFPGM